MTEAPAVAVAALRGRGHTALGWVLVRMHILTLGDLERGLTEQRAREGALLGDVLLDLQLVEQDELDAALEVQAQINGGDVVGGCAAALGCAYARAGTQAARIHRLARAAAGRSSDDDDAI